jgi:hypothetical protein
MGWLEVVTLLVPGFTDSTKNCQLVEFLLRVACGVEDSTRTTR